LQKSPGDRADCIWLMLLAVTIINTLLMDETEGRVENCANRCCISLTLRFINLFDDLQAE
jgi:hypothetical protein